MIELGLFFRPLSILEVIEGDLASSILDLKQETKYLPICTDSRVAKEGDAFVSLKGETFDADDFLKDVAPKVSLIVLEKSKKSEKLVEELRADFPALTILVVSSTIKYLQELASIHTSQWRKHHRGVLVGIAGSNGKTTTKEMLTHIVKNFYPEQTVSTLKNNNNHLGMPLTLLSIDARVTRVAIVEYGSNHPGEMDVLCRVALPDIAITTNIGHTHMEFFSDLKAVMHEEGAFYRHFALSQGETSSAKSIFLWNRDDEQLKNLPKYSWMKSFSAETGPSDFHYQIEGNKLVIPELIQAVENHFVLGRHNFINLGNALVITQMLEELFGLPMGSAEERMVTAGLFRPTPNRSQWLDSKFGNKIFLDAYNANPSSMKAALEAFRDFCINRGDEKLSEGLVILADMKELGESEIQHHRELGELVKTLGFQHVAYVGAMSDHFEKGLGRTCEQFLDARAAKIYWPKWIKEHPVIFLKGSRSLQLESLVDLG